MKIVNQSVVHLPFATSKVLNLQQDDVSSTSASEFKAPSNETFIRGVQNLAGEQLRQNVGYGEFGKSHIGIERFWDLG